MVALSNLNTTTGGLVIGDFIYSPRPLAAPEYLPVNSDEASYLSSSYPTLAAYYTTPVAAYTATNRAVSANTFGVSPSYGALSVAYGNGMWVAGVYNGTQFITSTDGINWIGRPSGLATSSMWGGIAYGNGIWVAIVSGGTGISTSPDGINWTYRATTMPTAARAIMFGGGRFMVTSNTSTTSMHISTDGINWITKNFAASTNWSSIAFGNGTYVAVATTGYCCTSTDYGNTWLLQAGITAGYQWVTYGNGVFVAIGGQNTTVAATSPNGVTWTARTLPSAQYWTKPAFGNGVFLIVAGQTSNATAVAATSPDGATWTAQALPSSMYWNAVGFGGRPANGFFVACAPLTASITQPSFVTTINMSVAQTAFTLPIIPPLPGTYTHMKAT